MKTNGPERQSAKTSVQPKTDWLELPAGLASRLDALCQRHPEKTRSQIVNQLLNLALAEHDRKGSMANAPVVQTATPASVYLPTGPFAEFHGLGFKHHLATERELDKMDQEASPPAGERKLGDTE